MVCVPRMPVHAGTHGTTAMADRILLTVHQSASQLTLRYYLHLCKGGDRTRPDLRATIRCVRGLVCGVVRAGGKGSDVAGRSARG